MELIFTKSFVKSYTKLPMTAKRRTDAALALFQEDPFHRDLQNHELKGRLKGSRSISAGFDLRIIFMTGDEGHAVVTLVKVGTHHQLYQ
jgi:addiction module RelE/StbE family toxin